MRTVLRGFYQFSIFALLTVMFLLRDGSIEVAGFGVMYAYIAALAIIAAVSIQFLAHPDIGRIHRLLHAGGIFVFPYVVPVTVSCFIWIAQFEGLRTVTRGLSYVAYQVLAVTVAVAVMYAYGETGVKAWFGAIMLANGITLVQTVATYGAAQTAAEWLELVTTFGGTTGDSMRAMELHNTVFAYGPFILLCILGHTGGVLLIPAIFFFVTGLKRIAVAGVAAALVSGLLGRRFGKRFTAAVSWGTVAGSLAYIAAIHGGLFDMLEAAGIDTMGRDTIYQFINGQFSLSPTFTGHGLGFSSEEWEQSGQIFRRLTQDAFHNDFLRMYVEIGFIPYIIWAWAHIPFRVGRYMSDFGRKGGAVFFAITIYLTAAYLTDNTFYYFYVTGSSAIPVLFLALQEGNHGETGLIGHRTDLQF